MNLREKEQIEIDHWKDSPSERPGQLTKGNLLNKMQQTRHLNYKIQKHNRLIHKSSSVLEIGAGQGWASCWMKKYYLPNSSFTVTDISPHAIESIHNWENLFDVQIDKSYACKSYKVPEKDSSFDLIFCYAAAHHFVRFEDTLLELKRVLKPNGLIMFIYEPTCSRLLYPIHFWYVNKVNKKITEDVIVPSELKRIAINAGLNYKNLYDPHQSTIRSIWLGIYFQFLRILPFLQKFLPSSSDMIFSHLKD